MKMKLFFLILLALLITLSYACYKLLEYAGTDSQKLIEVYYNQARITMFAGFLTLGSFLLTLQTAIIQRLREAYDSTDYARKVEQMRSKGKTVLHYGSLERVGIALATNVILAITTSLLQMTIGFAQKPWSTSICVSFGLTTIILVIYLTIQLVMAHHQWFKKTEEDLTQRNAS